MTQPERPKERMFVRCSQLSKPELGIVHVHARPWRPNTVFEVVYYPPGGGKWVVPEEQWESIIAATSMMEAMALLRGGSAESG